MDNFNIKLQAMLTQLHNIYKYEKAIVGNYDLIYDHLKSEGHQMEFATEEKNKMWTSAQKRFLTDHPSWKSMPEKEKQEHLIKYYKSEIVKKFLWDKYRETKMTLKLYDENGVQYKRIETLTLQ
jgi:hypothetical protein